MVRTEMDASPLLIFAKPPYCTISLKLEKVHVLVNLTRYTSETARKMDDSMDVDGGTMEVDMADESENLRDEQNQYQQQFHRRGRCGIRTQHHSKGQ